MNDISFSRTVFKGKNFTLDLFFHSPRMILSDRGRFTEEVYPILYFRQSVYGPDPTGNAWADKTLKIRPKSLVRFVRLINEVCKWFEKEDLFLINDQNETIFNIDYGKMKAMLERADPDDGALAIVPAAIPEGASQKPVEGAILYINKMENIVMVSRHELESLLWTLTHFSFTEEMNHLILSAFYAQTNKMIIPQSQVKKNKGPF